MLSIKGTQWSPDGERARDVNIRVGLSEAGGDRGVHPSDFEPPISSRRMRLTREMFERFGVTAQTFTLRDVAKGFEQEHVKEPEGASRVARDRESVPGRRSEPET